MAETTTDHDTIRAWAEKRKGVPASVEGTAGKDDDAGILRIEFPGVGRDEDLTEISWDQFFEKFEEKKLAFLYEDKSSDGQTSRFCKFIERDQS